MSHAWADRLRNLATVMVVAIHVAAPVAESHPDLNTWAWWAGNWWNSLARAGVPLFVMLSGYLLLGKDYPTGKFIQKRFLRVIVPALFWMAVYLIYGHLAKGIPGTFSEAVLAIAEGPVHYHLWFIYLIIGLYLFYPVLRPWVRQARDSDFGYVLALCAIASWGYKILFTFFDIHLGLYWEFYTNNVGYFVLGYFLGEKIPRGFSGAKTAAPHGQESKIGAWPFSKKQLGWLAVGLIVVGTSATAFGTFWAKTSLEPGTHRYFYDYLTPNVGFAAIGWFLLVRHFWDSPGLLEIERAFAEASFGVYFMHVLVMDWWAECGFWHSGIHPAKGLPLLMGLILGMTFLAVCLVRCLPFGKKIT